MRQVVITFVCSFFLVVACSKNELPRVDDKPLNSTTKAGSAISTVLEYDVSLDDIEDYLIDRQNNNIDRGISLEAKRIEQVIGSSGIVTSYIINYDRGCEIISADKRTPALLAYSESENIDFHQLPEVIKNWLIDLNTEIEKRKEFSSRELSPAERNNVDFWDKVKRSSDPFDPPEIPGDYPPGHWVLVDTNHQIVDDVVVGPLIPVKWGQGAPYNNYCPLVRQDLGNVRSPAGCVAVAGAQLLYYLHYNLGVPATAPSTGYVSGYVYPSQDYTQTFSNESTTIWDQMASQSSFAAPFIGSIGKAVNTQYAYIIEFQNGELTNLQSGATESSFPYYIVDNYGIYWTWSSLTQASDVNSVITSINNGSPVYVGASSANGSASHAFLIDSWKRVKHKWTNVYEYVCDDPMIDELLNLPAVTIITYSDPIASYFGMNWGYEGTYDSLWFSPLGVWNPGDVSYSGYRHLYYNFHSL